jgi:hypothetical protein
LPATRRTEDRGQEPRDPACSLNLTPSCAHRRSVGSAGLSSRARFRVNANGKLLDVWLLVRCVLCDRTNKLPVHERAAVRSIDPGELHGYHVNDPYLVASRLLDPLLARRNHFTLDWTGAWRLDAPPAVLDGPWPVRVEVTFVDPVPVRPERLIAQGLGLSRNEVLRGSRATPRCAVRRVPGSPSR